MLDVIKNAYKNIFRKKLRSFLTMAGIGIGVMSVTIISAIGDIGKDTINNEMESIGIGGLAVSANKNADGALVGPEQLELINNMEQVEIASPLMLEYTDIEIRNYSVNSLVWGIDNNANKLISMELKHGRLINRSDIGSCAQVCVVDEKFAVSMYKRSNITGKVLKLLIGGEYREFEIVGVVKSGGNVLQNIMGEFVPNFIYIPVSSASQILNKVNYDQIIVKLDKNANSNAVISSISNLLEKQSGAENSIRIENLAKQKEKLNSILEIITFILSSIAAISLIVAGLSIMTVMLVSVHERTREIGIKKSIGAKRRTIMIEFITESFLISAIGSAVGTITGTTGIFVGCLFLSIKFNMNTNLLLFNIIFSVFIGIIFGVYPAIKAAGLNPVEALRYE